jgi:hypothetical protein
LMISTCSISTVALLLFFLSLSFCVRLMCTGRPSLVCWGLATAARLPVSGCGCLPLSGLVLEEFDFGGLGRLTSLLRPVDGRLLGKGWVVA